jgi:hypothetical protein
MQSIKRSQGIKIEQIQYTSLSSIWIMLEIIMSIVVSTIWKAKILLAKTNTTNIKKKLFQKLKS